MNVNAAPSVGVRWAILVVGLGATSVLFLDLCDLIFACGCEAFWLTAAEHCNIQTAGRPDCPWCATGIWGSVVPIGAVAGAQAMAALPSGTGSAASSGSSSGWCWGTGRPRQYGMTGSLSYRRSAATHSTLV
ncbi:MAG: hypothetical protein O3A25_16115, partial [Acidobacteria bacterium]|nr:hypothetical protein [Acidobacteriota bacterium]